MIIEEQIKKLDDEYMFILEKAKREKDERVQIQMLRDLAAITDKIDKLKHKNKLIKEGTPEWLPGGMDDKRFPKNIKEFREVVEEANRVIIK